MDAQTVTRPDPLTVDDIPCIVDDIPWRLPPIARLEDVDPLTLSDAETSDYARQLQGELRVLRVMLSVALAQVTKLTTQLKRAGCVIESLQAQIRDFWRERRPA